MMFKSRKTYTAMSVVILALMLAVMACTANDTLIIHLTATATLTITPTPLNIETKYKVGDKLQIIGSSPFAGVGLNMDAGPYTAATGATQCLPGTGVTVSDVSKNIVPSSNDSMLYYLISCNGKKGWIPEFEVTNRPKGTKLVIKSEDGAGAAVYQQNDAIKGKALADKCPDGTPITVADAQTGKQDNDTNVYFQITCAKLRGYVLEKDVASVS